MREGIQGPLANCSLFSQTVFLARWTVGARRSASPPSAGRGTGCRPEQVAARHTFGPDCVSRAGRNAFVRRMCIGRGPRRCVGSALGGVPGQTCGLIAVRREGPSHLPAVLLDMPRSRLLLNRRFPSRQSAGDGECGGDGGPCRRSVSSAGRDGPRTTQRPRRRNAAGAKAPRYSRQCYCCARQRFIFMWRRTKYVASRAMIAASTTSTAVISGLCPVIPTLNVAEELASV